MECVGDGQIKDSFYRLKIFLELSSLQEDCISNVFPLIFCETHSLITKFIETYLKTNDRFETMTITPREAGGQVSAVGMSRALASCEARQRPKHRQDPLPGALKTQHKEETRSHLFPCQRIGRKANSCRSLRRGGA